MAEPIKQIDIRDRLHNVFNTSSKLFIKEIILIVMIYMFYSNVTFNTFFTFIKYTFLFLSLRFILSFVTEKRDSITKKKYFDLNAPMIIFATMILLTYNTGILYNKLLLSLIIVSYSIYIISTQEYYTSDVIITLLLVYSLMNNPNISYFIETDME
jgi:hypothetical protein